ncbi:MAG TPA: MaoC/PaaZ C-terminal domain-containing protein [Steroidobacter sp.]|nr:MaoC/PaaZ C-terminal domain-containing protein [Steroidobacter sp.]
MTLNWNEITAGQELPAHECGPVSRWVLAMFAGGSGDHMPVHVDIDFARKFGMKDVFAHGMLSMAYLGQLLLKFARQEHIRNYAVRFTSITPVNARVSCTGKVLEKFEADGERRIRVAIQTKIDDGTVTLEGEAVIAVP